MRDLNISYQVKGQNTFLVLEEPKEQRVIGYCVRMLENNRIPGLLPMFSQVIDDREKMNYDITGKMKLGQMVQNTLITEEIGKKILLGLTKAMMNLESYFLTPWGCVLSEEYVFVDSRYHVFMLYDPIFIQERDYTQELKNFFLAIVGLLSSNGTARDQFNECLHFLIRPGFSLPGFQKLLEPDGEEEGGDGDVQGEPEILAEELPQGLSQKQESQKESRRSLLSGKNDRKSAPELFGGGILIPGDRSENMDVKEVKPSKAEKGGFRLFRKKKQPKVELELENHVMPADRPALPSGQWSGTVNLEEDMGRTVLKSDSESGCTPYIQYQGRNFPLSSFPFTIGKQENCSLRMNNPTVSRQHATITREEGIYFITDENSRNSTYVNGQVIPPYSPTPLSDGDRVVCSNQEFIFKKE